jgi:NAD(P)-dependent dehydrogenase (short-subunit alcohol dehydrogenase family)
MYDAHPGMSGKVALITGATSGIGAVAARELARMGATVVVVGREGARAAATVAAIQRQTANPHVEALLADLSSQEQVRRLASEFAGRYPRLDVLLNNAGAVQYRHETTVDGLEMTFALNHLAPFLLTNLLMGRLLVTPQARVVTVASVAHLGMSIPFDDLQHAHTPYRSFQVYGQSKLANIMFTYELARRLAGTTVTANALHPGFVASNFGMAPGGLVGLGLRLARIFAISAERGAQTSVYLASSPDVEGVTGQYFAKCRPVRSSRASYDVAAQRRLWDVSAELTGLSVGESATSMLA